MFVTYIEGIPEKGFDIMPLFDFKKADKKLYQPGPEPVLVDVPAMRFLMAEGQGDPNTSAAYQEAVEMLYGLAYTIKMSKKGAVQPPGYFDFVVPPLEGLWSLAGAPFDGRVIGRKEDFEWTMMLRMPDFVDQAALDTAKEYFGNKKPELDLSKIRLTNFAEGLCAQILHLGAYDEEPATLARLDAFIKAKGFQPDMAGMRRHHEIYLSDPRKTEAALLKTVLRHPVQKA